MCSSDLWVTQSSQAPIDNNVVVSSIGDGVDPDGMDALGSLPVNIGADSNGSSTFIDWITGDRLAGSKITGPTTDAGDYYIAKTSLVSDGSFVYYAVYKSDPSTIYATTSTLQPLQGLVFTVVSDVNAGNYKVDMIRTVECGTVYNTSNYTGSGGSGPEAVTYFNSPGTVSPNPAGSNTIVSYWSPDGGSQTSNAGSELFTGVDSQWVNLGQKCFKTIFCLYSPLYFAIIDFKLDVTSIVYMKYNILQNSMSIRVWHNISELSLALFMKFVHEIACSL